MLGIEDIVLYFQSLKSYERISMMCRLQHSCLPFELRFLGTCLEELGRRDFHELRPVENEANNNADLGLSEQKISDKHVQKKIILYLSLLHSHNYSCSNSLYKILCDAEEVNQFLRMEAADDKYDCLEQLLMIYTLAVNHPAFSCEQKHVLRGIFSNIQAHESKRSYLQPEAQCNEQQTETPAFTSSDSVQEQPPIINASPDRRYPPPHLPNTSHLTPLAPPYAHDLPLALSDQMGIAIQAPNLYRFPIHPAAWNSPGIPVVFGTAELAPSTQHSSFVSKTSTPSVSNTPSRSSSPAKIQPLPAPYPRSQIAATLPQPINAASLPQASPETFIESVTKQTSLLPLSVINNYTSEQLLRLTDEQLTELGMSDESIQQVRCMAADKRICNEDVSTNTLVDKSTTTETEPATIKEFMGKSVATPGIMYSHPITAGMDLNSAAAVATPVTLYLFPHVNGPQINGFVSPTPPELVAGLENDLNMMRLDGGVRGRNSNGSNSDTASSDQSSPPNTPLLSQNVNKRSNKTTDTNEWRNDGNNYHIINNDEKSNNGDSSSEEKNSSSQPLYQGRGRIINNRGRPKNQNAYSRGRGNAGNRRRSETSEDMRKTTTFLNNSSGPETSAAFQYVGNPVTSAAVTAANAAAFMQQHPISYLRSYPHSFQNSFIRAPPHHFPNGAEIIYHQYPPPMFSGTVHYSPMTLPKFSCYNCGTPGHYANDCSESTLEDASKPSQYRLDYTPIDGAPFNDQ